MNIKVRFSLALAIYGLFIFGGLAAAELYFVPRLATARQSITSTQASIVYEEQQQANLKKLSQDLADLENKQSLLSEEIWLFTAEDSFFQLWLNFGAANHVQLEGPQLADSTPNGQLITRTMSLTLRGSIGAVAQGLEAIQKIQPLVAIQKVTYAPDTVDGNVKAQIEAVTLWR
ncbi:MAG: hypothetical protein HY092_03940 [Candidatus Kerfeldbacteria bacterium]|nr:hypothetical protein [Candidatus Kerfeldbacteria bacterium]